MGILGKLLTLTILVAVGAVVYQLLLTPEPEVPKIPEQWFGKKQLKAGEPIPKDPLTINKFTINVSDEVLTDLKHRLDLARYVEPIPGTQFNYGFNGNYLKQVVDYWKTKYDWRQQEKELNKFNHFKTQINGIDIHFIHVKPSKPAKTVVPILISHGWPGSVLEYYKAIPLLTEPTNGVAFEVICPSIPGYGWSEAPHQTGFNVPQTARIYVKLMERLNHKTFFVHGGDWGSAIAQSMAILYPENVRGLHTTWGSMPSRGLPLIKTIIGAYLPQLVFDNPESDYKMVFPFWEKFKFMVRESGYMHLQSTRPDTIGAALVNSPVGLAAYILEKFSVWTNPAFLDKPDGELTKKFTLDELLTNIMIYWTSNNVASSMRYYKENIPLLFTDFSLDRFCIKASVPSAVADFPNELLRSPQSLTKYHYENLIQYTSMPRGGHFAAFEEPKLVADDIKTFVAKVLALELAQKSKQNTKI
ncbi:epoxide hydrolase 1-like [Oppia nitens]|uniref:epoxide hydrolase 1-like n=1 Tax=Oppia nitens TaxID=1686743 RepID=UPI0023DCC50D|nr:epoxide hydrolase 1-like [Oppia nitens]